MTSHTRHSEAANGASIDQRPALLTPRRREILELVAKGLTNEEIANILALSAGTVRIQLSNILAQLQVANRTEATAVFLAWKARTDSVAEVLARPAIAVLPFTALAPEPDAARAALALSEDLTTLFSRWCWFPVVRSAPLGAASPATTPKDLDARFVVSGTLRTSNTQWRVTARLDDRTENRLLWSEQYDLAPSALFHVQDELCQAIVATAYEVLMRGITTRVAPAQHPQSIDAWSMAHEGMTRTASRDVAHNRAAQSLFVDALAREPNLVLAHYGLGLCHYDAVLNQLPDADEGALLAAAQRCVDLAPHSAEGYYLIGRHHQVRGRHHEAIAPLELAIGRNPSFSPAHALLAQVLVLSGRPDEGLDRMKHALRLAPRAFVAGLATLHFLREEYELAIAHCESVIAMHPTYPFGFALAATSAYWLGQRELAESHLRSLYALQPGYSAKKFLLTFGPGFEGVDRFARGLEALGITP